MRTITISAALSAGLMAGNAMADQGNWVGQYGATPRDAIVGGKATATVVTPISVCRAMVNTLGTKYPGGGPAPGGSGKCSVNFGGIATSYITYDALVPGQKSASGGTIPSNATNKGAHGVSKFGLPPAPLYFCRADLGGGKGMQLGSLAPGSSGCLIPYGGTTQTASSYEVLVDLSPKLPVTTANVSGGSIPLDAVVGGYDTDGQTLYYCQASYGGALVPGKTGPKFNSCDIPWQGSEIYVASYQVLVPQWNYTSAALLTFPAWTYANGAKIHVCQGNPPTNPSLTLPGRFEPSSDSNCNLSNGSTAAKPFKVLSE